MTRRRLSSIEYNNPWMFKGNEISPSVVTRYFGFVYAITDKETGKMYIGRKYIWKKVKVTGTNRKRRVESDWKDYYSSHDGLKRIGKENPGRLSREILHLCQGQRRNQLSRDRGTI